jgi:hypothetical protein
VGTQLAEPPDVERVAIARAIERQIGNRHGQRTDKELVQNVAQVQVFLRSKGQQERIDSPSTAGHNDFQELRMRRDKHDDFKLVGVYNLTRSYIPSFPST